MSKRKAPSLVAASRQRVPEAIRALTADRELVSSGDVAKAAGVTRQAAHYHLARMVRDGELLRSGQGRGARYTRLVDFAKAYSLERLAEDRVWREVLGDVLGLREVPKNATSILSYAFTEMLNNAIDHSRGTTATVLVWTRENEVAFEILDDGVGAFRTIRERWGLPDDFAALQELAKGKATTAPERHSGEGIFFTSRVVDVFLIESGDLRWIVDNRRRDEAVGESGGRSGTRVRCEISLDASTTLQDVFDAFATDLDEPGFAKTSVRVRLYRAGASSFVSRSEAKRLASRLEGFEEVELDFAGVDDVGQGFVDELFRVWSEDHPGTKLVPVNMAYAVERMVSRARRGG